MTPKVFSLELVQFQFDLTNLRFLKIASERLYLVARTALYRISLDDPSKIDTVVLPAEVEEPTNVWVHPNGIHCIIEKGSSYHYLHLHYSKPKPMSRLKEHVTCVEWLDDKTESLTFVVGTTTGHLMSGTLTWHHDYHRKDDSHFRSVFRTRGAVTGMLSDSASSERDLSHLDLHGQDATDYGPHGQEPNGRVATRGPIQRVWVFSTEERYSWPVSSSVLDVFKTPPRVTQPGVEHMDLCVFGPGGHQYALKKNTKVIESSISRLQGLTMMGRDALITRYHLVTIDVPSATLHIRSQLTDQEVFTQQVPLDGAETLLGCAADYNANTATFWLYSTHRVWEIVPVDEAKDVWELLVAQKEYAEALASTESLLVRNMIKARQGKQYFKEGRYKEGVAVLAGTTEPFESVALELMDGTDGLERSEKRDALLDFILLSFKATANALQRRLLSSWIVELYATKLNELGDHITSLNQNRGISEPLESTNLSKQWQAKWDSTNESFERFIRNHRKTLDKDTVYQILTANHNEPQLLFFANANKDYNFTMSRYIGLKDWLNALRVLMAAFSDPPPVTELELVRKETQPVAPELLYDHATTLLVNAPHETIAVWVRLLEADYPVVVARLVPALLTFNKTHRDHVRWSDNLVVGFLQKVIVKLDSQGSLTTLWAEVKTIHDVYLSSLVTYPQTSDNQAPSITVEITKFLKLSKHLDPDFVVRLLLQHNHTHPAIQVLIAQRLHSTAIDLALAHHMTEMVEYILNDVGDQAQGPGRSSEENAMWIDNTTFIEKKKLWLKVAAYLINEAVCGSHRLEFVFHQAARGELAVGAPAASTSAVKPPSFPEPSAEPYQRLSLVLRYLLMKANGLLTLKDVLPLLPDFTTINHFQDEIIHSLQAYNMTITRLSMEMKESTDAAERIKRDIEAYKTRFTIIEPGEECSLCDGLMVTKQFISFPCGHGFHKDCLLKFYVKHGDYKFQTLFEAFRKNRGSPAAVDKHKYVLEIDDVLLGSCVRCNESSIDLVDEPLVNEEDTEACAQWSL